MALLAGTLANATAPLIDALDAAKHECFLTENPTPTAAKCVRWLGSSMKDVKCDDDLCACCHRRCSWWWGGEVRIGDSVEADRDCDTHI